MTTIDITIGWTISDMPRYSSFDGYQAGARQHSETLTLDIDTDQPMSRMVEVIAEAAFEATNSPAPQMVLAKAIKTALDATGYRGAQAHYSLSVGDTVTIGEATLACDRFGWKSVSLVPPVLVP